jgi:hypothetical protein
MVMLEQVSVSNGGTAMLFVPLRYVNKRTNKCPSNNIMSQKHRVQPCIPTRVKPPSGLCKEQMYSCLLSKTDLSLRMDSHEKNK